MTARHARMRVCPEGHRYTKSTECPTCPICEQQRKPETGFLAMVPAPARRALEREGIATLDQLAGYSAAQLLALHGIGPSSIPKLRAALAAAGLAFRE